MDKTKILKEILTTECLANHMAYFESCYQTFLGMLSGKTSFDQQEAMDKVVKMNKTIDPDHGLAYILQAAQDADSQKEIRDYLRDIASHTALQDFLDWDDELEQTDQFEIRVQHEINEGTHYTTKFNQIVEDGFKERFEAWQSIFEGDLVEIIRVRFERDELSTDAMLLNS